MTNKAFYQLAADEVAKGNIDQALWIKVVADMSTATKIQQQAKYIQLRAGEFAVQSATTKLADSVPIIKRVLKWVVGLVVVGFVITFFFAMVIARKDDQDAQRIALADAGIVENHLATHELKSQKRGQVHLSALRPWLCHDGRPADGRRESALRLHPKKGVRII